jgi:hypothetical protein
MQKYNINSSEFIQNVNNELSASFRAEGFLFSRFNEKWEIPANRRHRCIVLMLRKCA